MGAKTEPLLPALLPALTDGQCSPETLICNCVCYANAVRLRLPTKYRAA